MNLRKVYSAKGSVWCLRFVFVVWMNGSRRKEKIWHLDFAYVAPI